MRRGNAQVQQRNHNLKKTENGRNRPLQPVHEKGCQRNRKKQKDAEHREQWVRPQTHRQGQKLLASDCLAETKVRAENDQPDEKHSGDRGSIKHEESILRGKDREQNGCDDSGG